MSFIVNIEELRARAAKRVATVANAATLLTSGSKVAALSRVAEDFGAPAGRAQTCPAYNAKTPTPTQDRPYRLSRADADRCHRPVWSDAEITTFVNRVSLFMRRGINATDADDLAESLVLRDRAGLDTHLCIECSHYRPGRCGNHHVAGLGGPALPRDMATVLQDCPGFTAAPELD